MAEIQKVRDEELKGIQYKIRDTLQVLQLEYGLVDEAVNKCSLIHGTKNQQECVIAAEKARQQVNELLRSSKKLVDEVNELYAYVKGREFF